MVGLMVMAAFFLAACGPEEKGKLVVTREMIRDHPEEVQRLLREHNITNVRIVNRSEFEEEQRANQAMLDRAEALRAAADRQAASREMLEQARRLREAGNQSDASGSG